MDFLTVLLLGLGLSMDAFAVSVSNGLCYRNYGRKKAFISSLSFGVFQALMPVLGYFAGRLFANEISAFDHYIALILLALIGGNMIYDAVKELRSPERCVVRDFDLKTLLLQSVATSIDALAVGVSLAAVGTKIVPAALSIGVITFVACLFGVFLGKKFGIILKDKARIFGGALLVIIGLKIFLEHTFGA